jgi:DNA replication protein DnaC
MSRLKTPGLSRVLEVEGRSRERAGGLGRIEPRMLRRMTFENFDVRGNNPSASQRRSLESAYNFARNYASDPEGWLVFIGETGVGKTHLAVAVASERLKAGHPVFFAMVADLLDHLRAAFGPNSAATYDQRFEEVKNTPLLILDDLGKERSSPWADEKLHQIIAHRHNARLPTVITSMVDFTRPEVQGPMYSRIQDPDVGELFKMEAPDYRTRQRGRQAVSRGKPRGPASS